MLYGGGFAAFLEDGILVSQPSPRGEGAPKGRIGHRRYERQMRKAERCSAYVGKREPLTANGNDLIRASLKITHAPSSGRGRRAKRGGVGFPECGSTVTRGQPPPRRGCVYRHRYICGEADAFSAISAAPNPPLPFPLQRAYNIITDQWSKIYFKERKTL